MLKKYLITIISLFFRGLNKIRTLADRELALQGGLEIGRNTILVGRQFFGTEPYLIKIGDNCLLTDGIRFITHDGSVQVPLIAMGELIKDVYSNKSTFAKIEIGDNVFVGISSIILPGTIIGSNSIVAAGSVVKGEFPPGVVLAGQPAKVICTIDEYCEKNIHKILNFRSDVPRKNQVLLHLTKL